MILNDAQSAASAIPGAIYQIVTCGDGRRAVFHDDGHYARFINGLADEVQRSAWDEIA